MHPVETILQTTMRELKKDHFVYCNEAEYQAYLKELRD